jgi:hypothetical protein
MERQQSIVENGALNSRDFIISLGITREGSEEFKIKALYGAVKFCRVAKRSCFSDALKNLRSKNIEITRSRLHEEEENFFGIESEEKINSFEEEQREIFSRVVDFIGMDDDKVCDLRKILYSKWGMDKEGVNLFGGSKRVNLSLLEDRKKRKIWEQSNKKAVLEDRREDKIRKQFNKIISTEYIGREVINRRIRRDDLVKAYIALQQKYETGSYGDIDFGSFEPVLHLMCDLERWSRRPFGLGWRKKRIDYISKVAETGEWREQNSVK